MDSANPGNLIFSSPPLKVTRLSRAIICSGICFRFPYIFRHWSFFSGALNGFLFSSAAFKISTEAKMATARMTSSDEDSYELRATISFNIRMAISFNEMASGEFGFASVLEKRITSMCIKHPKARVWKTRGDTRAALYHSLDTLLAPCGGLSGSSSQRSLGTANVTTASW